MTASKRLTYLDTAKGIGVFLVLIGHLQGEPFFSYSPIFSPLCKWIFSFHMPLFFIISGMLIRLKNDENKDLKTLATKRFRGIMIPYYWFSFFYLLAVVYALIRGNIQVGTLYEQIWYVLSLYGMSVLWFLPALFLGELLFLLIMKKAPKKLAPVCLLVTLGLGIVFNMLLKSFTYETVVLKGLSQFLTVLIRPLFVCSFIAVGYYAYGFFKEREKKSIVELLIGLVLMAIDVVLFTQNSSVDFRSLVYGNLILYYVCAITASLGLILICKNLPDVKPVIFWGCNSLIVMAVHNSETVLFYAMKLAMYINQFVTRAKGYISYLVIVLVITAYSTIMILLINRFFGFIVGKPSPFDHLFRKDKKCD